MSSERRRCPTTARSALLQKGTNLLPPCVAGVVSLVAVHPSTVSALGKQLLPKTFGQSNVNIAQQVVRGPGRRARRFWTVAHSSGAEVGVRGLPSAVPS